MRTERQAVRYQQLQTAACSANRWRCRGQTEDERFQRFDCNWVGNWIRPGSARPRSARLITPMNRDEWVDSVELAQVPKMGLIRQAPRQWQRRHAPLWACRCGSRPSRRS